MIIVPVYIDNKDRFNNCKMVLSFLEEDFDESLYIHEQGLTQQIFPSHFHKTNSQIFHRTKIVNDIAKQLDSKWICIHDCDVFCGEDTYKECIKLINNDRYDCVYPYKGMFLDVKRVGTKNMKQTVLNPLSYGGCLFWNRKKFLEIGGYNEKCISWGPEDVELYERANILGCRIYRTGDSLFHLHHERGPNSNQKNPYYKQNVKEFEKVRRMSGKELRRYVSGWSWTKI